MAKNQHALKPLLNWLCDLKIVSEHDAYMYMDRGTRTFFDELRNGYILGKLALIAVPHGATAYRADLCTSAMTRYYL